MPCPARNVTGRLPDEPPFGKSQLLPQITFAKKVFTSSTAIRLEQQPTGSEVWQVTTERLRQSNIYCEIPYCSRDSRYFVYERANPELTGSNKTEFVIVEIGTWNQHRLDVSTGISGSAISHDGVLYYLKQTQGRSLTLMRADLSEGKPEPVFQMGRDQGIISMGTVSPCGRYYVWGKRLDDGYKMFGILLMDLEKQTTKVIDQDPYILNPHPQFEPGEGKQLLIQHNRGGLFSPDGKLQRLVGPEGATLYLLSSSDGKRTMLQVGTPHTTPATGHEAWVGNTKEVLLTVAAREDYTAEKGNLLGVRADEPARVVAKGYRFNHVSVSRCGRLFCCDDWQENCKIVIGSVKTGRTAVVCESKTSMGRAQNTHAHAYLTPDLKWVIFNSDRSGFPHIHAASVPQQMVEEISAT
jgi:hypothetical protein